MALRSKPSEQLGVEHDHPLRVSSESKTDSPNAVINIRWVRRFPP